MKEEDCCDHSIARHDDAGCLEPYCPCRVSQSQLMSDTRALTPEEEEKLFFERGRSSRIFLYGIIGLFNTMAILLGVISDIFLAQPPHIFWTYVGVIIGINIYVFSLAEQYANKTIKYLRNRLDRLEKKLD
jgi:hypothetical protein